MALSKVLDDDQRKGISPQPDSLMPWAMLTAAHSQLGEVDSHMVINAHKHNYVTSATMDELVDKVILRLHSFKAAYRLYYGDGHGPSLH